MTLPARDHVTATPTRPAAPQLRLLIFLGCALGLMGSAGLLAAALPQAAHANWLRVASTPSVSQPYYVCPAHRHRDGCGVIEDPTPARPARGPLAAGAITTGPEEEVSPETYGHGEGGGYSPADLQSAYGLAAASASGGSGQTVGVVVAFNDPDAESDLARYRSEYGLAACGAAGGCFRKLSQTGTSSYPAPNEEWAREASLDLDMVSAVCPNCHILLVEAESEKPSDLAIAENEAVALGATEVGDSFLGEEKDTRQFAGAYDHPGVPIAAAAGDEDYAAGTGAPASYPGVIAVGGTSLRPSSGRRGWSETVWGSETGTAGTGSGCTGEPKPAWQTDAGCPFRTDNDVAAVGDPNTPVSVYDSYVTGSPWLLLAGTSASAPIIASAMALATPYTRSLPGARAFYLEAGGPGLNDVTSGLNGKCGNYLCEAKPGYDGPTGLGTPNGVPEVANPALVNGTPSSITDSGAQLNATVNPHGGEVRECRFEYGPAGSGPYPSSTPCTPLPGTATSPVAVSASIAVLLPNTSYRFSVTVTFTGGTESSAEQSFTTLAVPSASTGTATSVASTSLSLTGEVDPNGNPITECDFEYGRTQEYGSHALCAPAPGGGENPVAVTANLTGLTPGVSYHYRLRIYGGGVPHFGADRTVTLETDPPGAVTGPALAITQTSAVLSATVEPDGAPLTVCTFEFDSSEHLIPCSSRPVSAEGRFTVSASVSGLGASTVHRFRLVAANPAGTTNGVLEEFATLSAPLEPALPAVPAQIGRAKLTGRTLLIGASGGLSATVRCPAAYPHCSGTLTLQTRPGAGASSRRPVLTLATGSFTGRIGGLGTVRIRLSRTARAMIARTHLLRVTATVRTRQPSGPPLAWISLVTLRRSG